MFFLITLTALLATFIGLFFKRVYSYWSNKGVPHVKGSFPWGSKPNIQFSSDYQGKGIERFYKQLAPHAFGGVYLYTIPQLLIRDPEMVKLVLVKDFSHFQSRENLKSQSTSVFSKNLFSLESDLWKSLRVKLTPTFTSGKLKNMTDIFDECSRQLVNHLSHLVPADSSVTGVVVNVKDTVARFTTDVIVSTAFGIESHSIDSPENSLFREIGKMITPQENTTFRSIRNAIFAYLPSARRFLKTGNLKKAETFLVDSIKSTIDHRERNNVKRNDFLNLLIELKNKKGDETSKKTNTDTPDIEMDLVTIVAQCFIFFGAGFETSSSVQTFALYLMATHQDIQGKVRNEMQNVLKKHGGKPTYQAFQEMTYLDQVINETMRLYPTLPNITRVCTKDYPIPGTNAVIERGTKVIIPVYALHHDPKYFPDPEKFDPDRFSQGNETVITPYTFLPFGDGPRNCIGMRFGLLQTKFGLFSILNNFKVLPCKETEIPLILCNSELLTVTRNPVKLKFQNL